MNINDQPDMIDEDAVIDRICRQLGVHRYEVEN